MTFSLPLFIDVDPETLSALLACARRVEGFPAGGAKVLAAAIAVEQLIKDRQPTDAAVVERVFAQGYAPNWEEMLRPGLAEVSVQAVAVLLAYARGEIAHVGWCFSARDDEELETQLPANSVESCPVCDSVYEIQKHARRVRVWRSTFLEGAGGVTHHEKFNAEKGEVPGQEPA